MICPACREAMTPGQAQCPSCGAGAAPPSFGALAPELDFGGKRNPDGQGFAAFGRVVRGMDVVRKIQAAPREEQRLTPPVRIRSVRRVR